MLNAERLRGWYCSSGFVVRGSENNSLNPAAYNINTSEMRLPALTRLALNGQNIALKSGAVLVGTDYVFKGRGSHLSPYLGDHRVSYYVLDQGINATILGRLVGGTITAYNDEKNRHLFRVFKGTRDEAIATLHKEFVLITWLIRGGAFLMMWIGLGMLFGPVNVLFSILPAAGAISRFITGTITFFISVVLSAAALAVSMVLHSVVALAVLFALGIIIVIGIAALMKRGKKTAVASQ
ncbi:MAG: TMEM43 family protein [bacterium]